MKNSKLEKCRFSVICIIVVLFIVISTITVIKCKDAWVTVCNKNKFLTNEVRQLNKQIKYIEKQHTQENIITQNEIELLEQKISHRNATIIQLESALQMKIAEESRVIVFDASDITVISNVKEEELQAILKDTALESLTPYIIQAERNYGVNALAITSIIALESSWGTNYNAEIRNNYGGITVNGEYKIFNSSQHCINYLAELLKNEYLTPTGKWWSGSKSVESVSKQYCEKPEHWANIVVQNANKFEKLLQG